MLNFYSAESVDKIRGAISSNLSWYYGESDAVPTVISNSKIHTSSVSYSNFGSSLQLGDGNPSQYDAENALIVYRALSDLTPHQASIDRLWVYLCHTEARTYTIGRWYTSRKKTSEDDIKNVVNHFFVSGDRSLIRDNAISRLWWLGKIAIDIDPDNPENFLEIILHKQDVRSALIERPSTSRNRTVLKEIYTVMCEYWENGGELFARDNFRKWMVNLNRRGGVILFDALSTTELDKILNEEAERAIENSEE